MAIYIALSLMPLFVYEFCRRVKIKGHEESRHGFYFIVGAILLVIMGFRSIYLGSTDTYNYYNMMTRAINTASWDSYYNLDGVEAGFQLFTWALAQIFEDPQWIVIISSAIYIVSILSFIAKNSKDIALSITLYITLGLMTFHWQGMRQSIAMSICLFAYDKAKNRNPIQFLLLVLLAIQFHQTAIVFLPVYFLVYLRVTHFQLAVAAVAAIAIILLGENIAEFGNVLFDRDYTTAVDSGGFVASAIYILIIAFVLIVSKRPYRYSIDPLPFYVLVLGCAVYLLRYFGTLAAERISFYFMFAQLIILPNAIHEGVLNPRDKKLTLLAVYALSILLFMYRLNGSDFVPYLFCWE